MLHPAGDAPTADVSLRVRSSLVVLKWVSEKLTLWLLTKGADRSPERRCLAPSTGL